MRQQQQEQQQQQQQQQQLGPGVVAPAYTPMPEYSSPAVTEQKLAQAGTGQMDQRYRDEYPAEIDSRTANGGRAELATR